jgi:hypothetical protein
MKIRKSRTKQLYNIGPMPQGLAADGTHKESTLITKKDNITD